MTNPAPMTETCQADPNARVTVESIREALDIKTDVKPRADFSRASAGNIANNFLNNARDMTEDVARQAGHEIASAARAVGRFFNPPSGP